MDVIALPVRDHLRWCALEWAPEKATPDTEAEEKAGGDD